MPARSLERARPSGAAHHNGPGPVRCTWVDWSGLPRDAARASSSAAEHRFQICAAADEHERDFVVASPGGWGAETAASGVAPAQRQLPGPEPVRQLRGRDGAPPVETRADDTQTILRDKQPTQAPGTRTPTDSNHPESSERCSLIHI